MSTTEATRPDLAALTTRADYLERAAGVLEARHARHLDAAGRALRDSYVPAATRGYGAVVRERSAGFVKGENAYGFNGGNENSWHYRADGQRKRLADYAELCVAWCRGEGARPAAPADGARAPGRELADLDLALDLSLRAGADRRIAATLSAPPDDWTVDDAGRELAERELVRAIVEGQELVDAVAEVVGPPPVVETSRIESSPNDGRQPAVIYCRVSTREQGMSGLGLDAQENAAREECVRRGWRVVQVFREVVSGAKAERPLFEEACALVAHHRGVLVAAKADRLSRAGVASVLALHERAHREGWWVYALDMPEVDTTSPMGEFILTILAAVNRLERRMTGARTKDALAVARVKGTKSGRPIGRPRALDPATREKDPAAFERMSRALPRLRELRTTGASYRSIARTLNAEGLVGPRGGTWTDMTVMKALRRYGLVDSEESAA